MSSCYEYIRSKTEEDKQVFCRLENYFKAVDEDKVDEYHDKRKRKEEGK